ncbi:hypothetical protein TNCV_2003081 [Trichonephila clavipes]|nr:hypothetical protein TNCV_2003081 [Trichonephila clavipes]
MSEAVVKKEHFHINIDTPSDSVVVTVTVYPCSVGRKPARQTFRPLCERQRPLSQDKAHSDFHEIPSSSTVAQVRITRSFISGWDGLNVEMRVCLLD